MGCEYIDCENLPFSSPSFVGVIPGEPPDVFIRYLFDNDTRGLQLPCPDRKQIDCCHLVQIINKGLCGFTKVLTQPAMRQQNHPSKDTISTSSYPSSRLTATIQGESTERTNEFVCSHSTAVMLDEGRVWENTLLLILCVSLSVIMLFTIAAIFIVRSGLWKKIRRRILGQSRRTLQPVDGGVHLEERRTLRTFSEDCDNDEIP